MSIESSHPVQSLTPLQNIDGNTVQAQKNKTAVSADNQENRSTVSLSDTLDQLPKQDCQDIDVAKVEHIKDAIRDGSLTMDSGKIANALISQAQSMLDE